jgi:hypothetical protein
MPSQNRPRNRRRTLVRSPNINEQALAPELAPLISQAFRVTFGRSRIQLTTNHVKALCIELVVTRAMRAVTGPDDPLLGLIKSLASSKDTHSRGSTP